MITDKHTVNLSLRIKSVKLKMFTYLIACCFIWQVAGGVSDEILTLQKKNHITCITENKDSSIFITPPYVESPKFESTVVKNGIWSNNDWLTKDASESAAAPVIDKRWEYFETTFGDYQYFAAAPVTVSIYTTAYTEFNMDDYTTLETFTLNHNTTQKWTHFHIFTKNQTTFILENNRILYYKTHFVPKEIFIVTETDTFWKKHNYQFRWANSTTKEEATTLTVFSPPEKKCLMLYMFLCPACFLTISIEDVEDSVIGSNDNLQQSWLFREFFLESNKESKISFYRGKANDDDEVGEWGIDVRWCPEVDGHNRVIYEANLNVTEGNKVCHLLKNQHTKKSKKTTKDKPFRCKAGLFGKHCSVNCEDVLGSEQKYCEEYNLCENSICECAWGYTGQFCQDSCSKGYWGLSCRNICKECDDCDAFTGQCFKEEKSSHGMSVVPQWTILGLISFSVYVVHV